MVRLLISELAGPIPSSASRNVTRTQSSREKSMSTLYRMSWVFSGYFGFLSQGPTVIGICCCGDPTLVAKLNKQIKYSTPPPPPPTNALVSPLGTAAARRHPPWAGIKGLPCFYQYLYSILKLIRHFSNTDLFTNRDAILNCDACGLSRVTSSI